MLWGLTELARELTFGTMEEMLSSLGLLGAYISFLACRMRTTAIIMTK